MTSAIEVSQLTKVYPTGKGRAPLRAVDSIDFAVPQGQVFSFLGPKGGACSSP